MISNLLLSDRLSLPYSKLDLVKFSTAEVIEKVLCMFPTNRLRVRLDNQIPNEEIFIDEMKFSLALRNLLDNAFKYSKDDSKVLISVLKKEGIEFQIKDKGIGISNKDINNITQPFFQANQKGSMKGFGLGLTISKKIIESHNGKLSIYSSEGKESVFILHLPLI